MGVDEARRIVESLHNAWSRQDLEETLSYYHPQIHYFCNMGGADGSALRVRGKSDMRAFLAPILHVAECSSVPFTFTYRDDVGRAQVEIQIRHRASGNLIHSTFRQLLVFEDGLIKALDEYHDGTRMKVFWEMVQGPTNPIGKNRSIISKLLSDATSGQGSPTTGDEP